MLRASSLIFAFVIRSYSKSMILLLFSTLFPFSTATSDYVTVSGSVEISETETSQCVSVSIVPDSLVEGEECFLLSFSSSSSDFILKSPSVATICIRDG